MVAVRSERGLVHERGVTAELLQSFARLQSVDSETERRDRWAFLEVDISG